MESSYLNDIQKSPFLFLKDHPWDYFKPISNILNTSKNGNLCDDDTFYRTFMSESNVQYINFMIKKTVYNNSCDKYIVTDQKREHLEQIMKGLYHDYAQHLQFNQKEQFGILNKIIIDYCVKTILTELDVRFKYIRDKSSPLEPLPQPINTSTSGSKSFLPSLVYNSTINFNTNNSDNTNNTNNSDNTNNSNNIPNIFDQKIISSPSQLPIKPQLNYQPYYFTDERTNMYAKKKSVSTNAPPTKFYNNPNDPDNSLEKNKYSTYKSFSAPAPVNYYIPNKI
jgi:hypothetical protein